MKQIFIRGMLVDASYDDPFLHREIDNGVFCPSSTVLRQMDEADGDDLEIHINSEGGDVFAFHDVANRIASYPGSVAIVIGACAFSEAANLVLLSGRPVYAHRNSIMLFHSAMTTVYDAAEGELRSEAEILDKINAPIKKALVEHGVPEEEVERGFRDRNALVLGIDDLVKYGIAMPLEEDAPEAVEDESSAKRLAALAEANQRIAALYRNSHSVNRPEAMKKSETEVLVEEEEKKVEETASEEKKEEGTPCAEEPSTEEEKKEEEAPVEETKEETPSEETKEEEAPSDEPEEEKKEEEGEDLAKSIADLSSRLSEALSTVQTFNQRLDALEEKLTEKEVELEDAKQSLKAERTKRIGAIAAAVAGNPGEVRPKDWREAVTACKGDKLEAYKKYPDLAKAWTKSN